MRVGEIFESWKDKVKAPAQGHPTYDVTTYENRSGTVIITVDDADPEEIEAQIWFNTTDPDEKEKLLDENLSWIRAMLDMHDLNVEDGDINERPGVHDGGMIDDLAWSPLEGGGPEY